MNKLRFYNTLSRKKEEFKPINDDVIKVYSCGPTVYNFVHIGNLRAYVFDDILVRVLKYNFGETKVRSVMNVTDVDDKTIKNSKIAYPELPPMEALKKFTAQYEQHFLSDMAELNILPAVVMPHATDDKYISEMQALIKKIHEAGYAYIKDGSIYFNLIDYNKNFRYGQLVSLDLSELKAGLRIDVDEYEKNNIQDFVLWKGKKDDEPFWNFELSGEQLPGRPGWHIECSAMAKAELGCPFDIHSGGGDLKFPHHEDELAQSAVGYGTAKPVNYWLHNDMLMVDGKKMSKSLGNVYKLNELKEKNKNPLVFRYLCLLTHYRKPLNFTWDSFAAAANGLEHLQNQVRQLGNEQGKINEDFQTKFKVAVNDDLNTPQAMAVLQEMLKSDVAKEDKLATVLDFDSVLGLSLAKANEAELLPADIQILVTERNKARQEKNWQLSDELRIKLEEMGYTIEDTKEGTIARKNV